MTKPLHDELKCPLMPEDVKVEVAPSIIETPLVIAAPCISRKRKTGKVKVRMVKTKVTAKKSRLEKVTSHLYDLDDCGGPEKTLNIDLGLYQMEDF
ncbi:MAG: hypothetical protein NWE96_10695 [Candidatus Bathyarchaeota archaeon]|nr:hypothetical protein [Candidatus Bathyarchaeota archaeon]